MKKQPRFDVYPARDGWRWRLVAANGRTIADSGEAYSSQASVKRAVATMKKTVGGMVWQGLKSGLPVLELPSLRAN